MQIPVQDPSIDSELCKATNGGAADVTSVRVVAAASAASLIRQRRPAEAGGRPSPPETSLKTSPPAYRQNFCSSLRIAGGVRYLPQQSKASGRSRLMNPRGRNVLE